MSEPVRIDPERLLAQTAWVRRLALSLSRDEASADDLAQDALATALRKPPEAESEGALRAWFAAVTRNLAIHRARGETRRARREHEAARPELERSQDRLRELEELRGELVKHVLTLPEESQQVVLLRYFDELDSAEIARRLSVPDSTVRNRLRRALAELRARLEREHGTDWRSSCLFVLPGPGLRQVAAGTAVAAAGGLWLGAGALAVLVLIALLAWPRDEPAETAGAGLALPSEQPAAAESDSARDRNAESEHRQPEAGDREATTGGVASELPATLMIQGAVLDELGHPVSEYSMTWFDELGKVRVPSHAIGNYVLENAQPGRWLVALSGVGWRSEELDVVLDPAPFVQRREFRMHRTGIVPVRLVDRAGRSLVQPVSGGRLPWPNRLQVCAAKRALPDVVPLLLLRDRGELAGSARYWDLFGRGSIGRAGEEIDGCLGYLELFDDPPLQVALVDGNVVVARGELQPDADELTFVISQEELTAKHQASRAGLRLRVVLPDGSVPRTCGVSLYGIPERMTLSPDGRVESLDLSPGAGRVILACPGYTRREVECELVAGEVRDLGDIRLAPERWLFVRFELPQDANDFVRFSVERATDSAAWSAWAGPEPIEQRAFAGKRGRLPWPGSGAFVLRVAGIGTQPPPGNREVRNDYHAGSRPVRFELDDASPDEITVRIVHTQRVLLRPPPDAPRSARWFLATDDGLPCRSLVTQGRAPLALELAPGGYVLFPVDPWTSTLGTPQEFTVAAEPLFLDLAR